jgi:hypothetical protein
MFKESVDSYISASVQKMTATDKKQLVQFIEMQEAYKRAAKMKTSVKRNSMKMSEIATIVRKVRRTNARSKNG